MTPTPTPQEMAEACRVAQCEHCCSVICERFGADYQPVRAAAAYIEQAAKREERLWGLVALLRGKSREANTSRDIALGNAYASVARLLNRALGDRR